MAGDEREFDAFVHARLPALLAFAHALTGDPHLAGDLVQDALERTGLRWSRLRRDGDPEAYVRRAIVNGRISRWRRQRHETLVADLPTQPAPDAPAHDEQLWRLLLELPPRQRAVVVLRYYEDLSEAEIARVLGCSTGTVKSQTSKALAKLRAALPTESTWTS